MKRIYWSNVTAARLKGITRSGIADAISRGDIVATEDGQIEGTKDPSNPIAVKNRAYLIGEILNAENTGFHPDQKIKAEIELKTITYRLKSLDFAKRMGVMVDRETVAKKFGAFADFMLNQLITFPENVADVVHGIAITSDNPVTDIATELKSHLSGIIKRAKEEALKVAPPEKGASYVFMEDD